MPESAHLWAIGYDNLQGAQRFRVEVAALGGPVQHLLLRDLAILARNPDGSYTLDRKPFPCAGNVLDGGPLGFLAGIALAVPMVTSQAVGALLGLAGASISAAVQIDDAFVRGVQAMLKPGASAVLMLDVVGDLDASLAALKGLGGTVLKTNVDVERAKLLQATLRARKLV